MTTPVGAVSGLAWALMVSLVVGAVPASCGTGTCRSHFADDAPMSGASMLQSQSRHGRLAGEKAVLEEGRDEQEERAVLLLAKRIKVWSDKADSCRGCDYGCLKGGECLVVGAGVTGESRFTQASCEDPAYNGTWCSSSPSCDECRGGCVVRDRCYQQTPWGDNATEAVCRKHTGTWCGYKSLACWSCRDGCLAHGHCYYRTPSGDNATERRCAYFGGEWCGQKVSCWSCPGGCILYGKCYPRSDGKAGASGRELCRAHGGNQC